MRKFFTKIVVLFFCFVVSAHAGKWLDYGNGMVNLDNKTMIGSNVETTIAEFAQINFEAAKVKPALYSNEPICVKGNLYNLEEIKTAVKNNKFKVSDISGHFKVIVQFDQFKLTVASVCDKKDAQNAMTSTLKRIRKFLDSKDTYLLLE